MISTLKGPNLISCQWERRKDAKIVLCSWLCHLWLCYKSLGGLMVLKNNSPLFAPMSAVETGLCRNIAICSSRGSGGGQRPGLENLLQDGSLSVLAACWEGSGTLSSGLGSSPWAASASLSQGSWDPSVNILADRN